MNRPLVRNLTLIGVGLAIVGFILFAASFAGSTVTPSSTDPNGNLVPGTGSVSGNNGPLLGVSILILAAGGILSFIAYVGALIKTAQLQRWGWFVVILLLGTIPLLIYAFAGPDAPSTSAYPGYPQGYMPPQGQQQYPPQYPPQYPQQPPPYQQPPQQQ